jgi:hypothetical protein
MMCSTRIDYAISLAFLSAAAPAEVPAKFIAFQKQVITMATKMAV